MEKEVPPPDSMTTVQIKPEYAPSESYAASEPPPAYQRPKAASVQVARIIAVTVVLVSFILGGCILASAYITANASCRHLEQELQLLSETMDRYQPLQPEALVQEEPQQQETKEQLDTAETKEATTKNNAANSQTQEESSDSSDSSESSDSSDDSEEDDKPVQIKLPLSIDFDDLAGAMMNNQRSKMNCVVEKKHAVEVVDHQPKTVNLPFGLNLTTDPHYERVTGERIAIFCESGNVQQQQRAQPDNQDQEETIMIQPVMIPIPPAQFHTHMPMQAQSMHPMESMRPPMPNPMLMPHHPQQPQMQQQAQSQLPPNQILHQIAQQIIAQKLQQEAQEEIQNNELRSEQATPLHRIELQRGLGMARIPIPEEVLTQINRLPNRDVIVAVSHQDMSEESENPEVRVVQHQRQGAQGITGRQSYARGLPVDIPVPMMQQEADEQEPHAQATEEQRPHFVHPRSVRSVDALLPKSQKRVKRCNCDCAC
ncbi:transcription factor SPT20 homolog [Atheta coriaria]|uniref:transcription factor SPT20 homolog n=1 Tax=Dalotia coriaria TaxID=877792 RepID=UPI0031F3D1A7